MVEESSNSKRRWHMLLISYFMTFSYLFALQSYPPVIPNVMETYDISYTQAGFLMSIVTLSGVFLALPSWILLSRWGIKRGGGFALIISTVGSLITSISPSFVLFGVGRFILGVGGIMIMVSSFSIIPVWFTQKDQGKAMGFKALDLPTAVIVAFNLHPIIAINYGWRWGLIISTAVLLASTTFFIFFFEERSKGYGAPVFKGLTNPQVWILGSIWALFNMSTWSFTTWAGTLFMEIKDVSRGLAFVLASLPMFSSLLLAPFVGVISDRFGKRKPFIVISLVGVTLSLLLISPLSLPLLLLPIFSLAITQPLLPPNLFSLPSKILVSENAGLGFGVLFTCHSIAILLGPSLTGYMRDISPELPSFFIMAAFSFLALIFAGLLRTHTEHP